VSRGRSPCCRFSCRNANRDRPISTPLSVRICTTPLLPLVRAGATMRAARAKPHELEDRAKPPQPRAVVGMHLPPSLQSTGEL
jgi:hypothetical protein